MTTTIQDLKLNQEEQILVAIENDDYTTLQALARATDDDEFAAELRQLAAVAYNNTWGYDESRDNSLWLKLK